jgi:hypothetical protein
MACCPDPEHVFTAALARFEARSPAVDPVLVARIRKI